MMRRCSVIRMPLVAHRASILVLASVTAIFRGYQHHIKSAEGRLSARFMASLVHGKSRSRQVPAHHNGGHAAAAALLIVVSALADFAEACAAIKAEGGRVVFADFEE